MINKIKKLRDSQERGFTLIELLVVIVIIGVLAAIALPIFSNQKVSAIEASAKSDLKNAATAVVSESTKTGGQYPTALPAAATTSEGIVLKMKAAGGALASNPTLNTPSSPNYGDYLSWIETEEKFIMNTGQSNLGTKSTSSETKLYFFYPKTSSWTVTKFTDFMKVLCTGATTGQGNTRQACQTEAGYEFNQSKFWNKALANGEVLQILVSKPVDDAQLVNLTVVGTPGSKLDINAYQGWKFTSGEAYNSDHYLEVVPSLASVDTGTWGSPLDTTSNSYCINATHETITSIKYHYDSNVGKVEEGLC